MMKWWMVRAGDSNELIPQWIDKKVASIGWRELRNPARFQERNQLVEEAHKTYSDSKPGARIQAASQVWRFINHIKAGDRVVSYAKDTREYITGTVIEEHRYDPTVISDYYPNVIGVNWESQRVPRDLLSQKTRNSLGATQTVFSVDQCSHEFENVLIHGINKLPSLNADDVEEEVGNGDELIAQAKVMVEDAVDRLDPWEMQELVAGLLRAMGYQAFVSPPGPDGGVDVIAHKDAFGFEKPVIKVQVKHRKAATGAREIQQLLGANPIGASSIFVSTGGFTSTAVRTAKHNGVKLLDLTDLVQLLLQWYEDLLTETKALLPLKRMYVPY